MADPLEKPAGVEPAAFSDDSGSDERHAPAANSRRCALIGTFPKLLLWLFVINLGIAFGAGLYEHRIVLSRWITQGHDGRHWNAQAVQQDDTGRRFWAFVTTGPLTLLTLASLIVAWRLPAPLRTWWLTAAGVSLVERLFTFTFFIPTMVRLSTAPDTAASVATALRWGNLNYLRHALTLTVLLTALKAFAVLYQHHAGR